MFDLPEKEKKWLEKYVANYPVHVIDARHMGEEELERFSGDLKIFFTLLRDKYNEETIKQMVAKYPDTWYTLAIVKGDERYNICAETEKQKREEEGEKVMDPNLDRIENKGFQRGISQGIERGITAVAELYARLTTDGRAGEMQKVMEDAEYRRQLLDEYELVPKSER